MNKFFSLFLLMPALLFAAVWNGTIDSTWYTSDKSATTYTITTAEQLAGLAKLVNNGFMGFCGKTIKLGTNIALNDTTGWRNWNGTTPGLKQLAGMYEFCGNFDGNGKVISGFYSTTGGLFHPAGANISNLGLVGFYVKNSYGSDAGGIVGSCYSPSCTVTNSYAIGNVEGGNYVGGIGGNGNTVINSYFAGTVTGSGSNVGGIVGSGTVTNSFYDSNLAGNLPYVSGTPKTTYDIKNEVCDLLQRYAATQNASDANSNYMGWKCNNDGYPSFSGTKAVLDAATNFESGTGTAADPYIIKTKKQLENFSTLANLGNTFENKYVKLGADIALNDTTGWRNWNETTTGLNQWNPITNFNGNFDGNGKVISGLYISTTADCQGIFSNGGSIKNLGLVGFYVKGGGNAGSISGCYSTVTNSYAIGNVKGVGDVGGISGYSGYGGGCMVTNSYFAGTVTGGSNSNVGGIAGSCTVTNSFYDFTLAGNLPNGTPKTTAEMQNSIYDSLQMYAAFLTIYSNSNYIGWKRNNGSYPSFSGANAETSLSYFASGTGTSTDPYIINTKKQLENFSFLSSVNTFENKYIKLGANIALNDTTGWRNWNDATTGLVQWNPINNFKGNFDGNGKVISGLYISTTADNQGLFGIAENANISNLGLAGFYVKGSGCVGSIAGCAPSSKVTNSYAIGNVNGIGSVGGIIGYSNYGATIADTYFMGDVTGNSYEIGSHDNIGGIIGSVDSKVSITNAYVKGNVSGSSYIENGSSRVGGIVGVAYGSEITITDAYIIGNVTSFDYAGGIVGLGNSTNDFTIANAYIIGNVTGGTVGGIVGSGYSNKGKFTIIDAYAIGNVTGGSAGGIAGDVKCNNELTISNTYAIGNIIGSAAGGIVGKGQSGGSSLYDGKITISNAYFKGNITGNYGAGGIVGYGYNSYKFAISNIYFIGEITSDGGHAGSLIGFSDGSTIDVTNSFYNSNLASSQYGISKTTGEMQNILTYIGRNWDFTSIWAMDSTIEDGYPFLQSSAYTKDKYQIAQANYIPSVVKKYTGSPIEPDVDSVMYKGTKLIKGTDYDLWYYNNVKVGDSAKIIIAGKGNYYGAKIVNFHIIDQTRNMAYTIIEPVIPEQITGDSIKPRPVVKDFGNVILKEGEDYILEYYDNKYAGQAIIKISGIGAYEGSRTINFSIVGRLPLMVNWSDEREFVYNKMVQVPKASIDASDIQWRVVNAQSAAGEYTEANKLAPFVQIISSNANSYELLNNTVDYEIKKRSLKPYFKVSTTFSNPASDTLWVPSEVFADSVLLRQALNSLLSYDGFAQDTVTKERDDASVLKNSPAITLTYNTPSQTQKGMLAKRVETTQTAVAVINTDGVSADNYSLAKRSIVIMETVDYEEGTEKVFCRRNAYCTELSETVCSFFGGVPAGSCEIKVSCLVEYAGESRCAANLSLDECRGIGGTALIISCEETSPIISTSHSLLATSHFRVWQTASGVVNLDLGYAPYAPVAVQVYNLQGKLIASEQASTRFATIRLNAGDGIYLFKAGNRSAMRAIK
jgi:hypothetical protein